MVESKSNRRSYNNTLRCRQKKITRDHILEALAALISEGRIIDFSIKEVADRAGVSYASVYRHFPTREALLEALYEEASEIMAQTSPFRPHLLEEIPAMAEKTVAFFEEKATIVQGFTIALVANNIHPQSRRQREELVEQMVAQSGSHLAPEVARQSAAIISHLHSSLTWVILKQRFEFSAKETTDALTWALETLIRDLVQKKGD